MVMIMLLSSNMNPFPVIKTVCIYLSSLIMVILRNGYTIKTAKQIKERLQCVVLGYQLLALFYGSLAVTTGMVITLQISLMAILSNI